MDTLGIQKCPHFMSFVDVGGVLWSNVICGCSVLRAVTGCRGESRYLPSNDWILNRKERRFQSVMACHALKLEPLQEHPIK